MKEVLRVHLEKAENRLLAEQKRVAQYQRLSKVQENLMSEDERLKRRKLRKVREGESVGGGGGTRGFTSLSLFSPAEADVFAGRGSSPSLSHHHLPPTSEHYRHIRNIP